MFEVGKFKHLSSTAFWHYAKVCNNQCFNRKGKVPRPRALPWIGWCGTNYTLWALLLPISSGPPRMLTIRFNLNQPLFEKGKVTVCCHFCSHWPSQSWGERARKRSWNKRWQIESLVTNVPRHLQVEVALTFTSRPTVEARGANVHSATSHFLAKLLIWLIHTGEKPHKCNQCNYSTNVASISECTL